MRKKKVAQPSIFRREPIIPIHVAVKKSPREAAYGKGSAGEISHSCARISWRAGVVCCEIQASFAIFCHLSKSWRHLFSSFFILFHLSHLSPSFRILGMAKPVLYDLGGLPGSGQSFFKRAEASRPAVRAPKMELARSWRKPGGTSHAVSYILCLIGSVFGRTLTDHSCICSPIHLEAFLHLLRNMAEHEVTLKA